MSYDSEQKDVLEDQAENLRQLVEETLQHKGEVVEESKDVDQLIESKSQQEIREQMKELKQSIDAEQRGELQDFTSVILEKIEQDDRDERYFNESKDEIELNMDDLTEAVEQLCYSKAEEFSLLGYDKVTGEEIWQCVSSKYKKGYPALHAIVNDILSLKAEKFMNWLLIQSYKS